MRFKKAPIALRGGTSILLYTILALLVSGCAPSPAVESTPTATATPFPTKTATARPTSTHTATPRPTDTATPEPTPTSTSIPASIFPEDHFIFARPIGPEHQDWPSRFYAFGSTAYGRYSVHHGADLENPIGTPVLAAGDGEVIVAGTDDEIAYGDGRNFYGNMVIIRHDFTLHDAPVYTVYGHLSAIHVSVGDRVSEGQPIAEVGDTGIALGPHLHFEVRVGANAYDHTCNPELWMRPYEGRGAIAGRLVDGARQPVTGTLVAITPLNDEPLAFREMWTYGPGVMSDPVWHENFAMSDIPAGQYQLKVSLGDTNLLRQVTVLPGQTTFVEIIKPQE